MRLEVIKGIEAFESVRPLWDRLWPEDPAQEIFTTSEWFRLWWQHFGTNDKKTAVLFYDGDQAVSISGSKSSLHVLAVREGDRLVALAPFILFEGRWRRCPVRILALPVNNHAPRSGILIARGCEKALEIITAHLAENHDWDMMLLDGISNESGLLHKVRDYAVRHSMYAYTSGSRCDSYLAMNGSWDEYFRGKGRHFRKHVWQLERNLAKAGSVTMQRYEGPEGVQQGLQALLEIDSESWKAKDGESFALHPALRSYYSDLARSFARDGACEIWVLHIDGAPVSGFLCFRGKDVLYTYKTSFREKFAQAKYSPGFLLMGRLIQDAWSRGLSVDFVGRMPISERWASGVRKFDHLTIFNRHMYSAMVGLLDWTARQTRPTRRWLAGLGH